MEESAEKEQRKLTLTDKFAREKERKDISDWKKIYLYREGTFLRAFNASAWLLATYVYNDEFRKQVGGKQPLQVQHLMSKTNGDYIFAGFPVASIDKYVTMCDKRDENSDVVVLTMCDIITPLFQTAEEYEEAYAKYLASLPPAKEKKDKPKQQLPFIYDSYSCIEGRGTHFGIERFARQIRQCTHNYQRDAYILSMDIKGYFIHIDRELLYEITRDSLLKMSEHYAEHGIRYCQILDFDFLLYILYEVIMLDPTIDCLTVGKESEYSVLPESKILKRGSRKGLPIGNLTSQLLSNVFLNTLDQYIKRVMLFRYYGRYVDDFHIIDQSRQRLRKAVPMITDFLYYELHLEVNQGKTHIVSARQGAEFLGAFVKPHRIYISSQSLRRVYYRMDMELPYMSDEERFASINSTLGVLSHYDSYNIRKSLTRRYQPLYCGFAHCNADRTKLVMNEV